MKFKFAESFGYLIGLLIHFAWTTPRQKWTTIGVLVGLILAIRFVPDFGLAVFGTAVSGWLIAVLFFAVFSGLVGNNLNLRNELAALKRKAKDQGTD